MSLDYFFRHGHSHSSSHSDDGKLHVEMDMSKTASALNMRGIFLHVAGDFFGSIVVCLSALLMYFFNNCDDETLENCNYHAEAIETGEFLASLGTRLSFIQLFLYEKSKFKARSEEINLMN